MMLKMSFFNECLSSLTLQDNNASYTYNRCLEYYSRVQDYCISLFSDVAISIVILMFRWLITVVKKYDKCYLLSTTRLLCIHYCFNSPRELFLLLRRSFVVFMHYQPFCITKPYSFLSCFLILVLSFLSLESYTIPVYHRWVCSDYYNDW